MSKRTRSAKKLEEEAKKQKIEGEKDDKFAYLREKQEPMPEVYTKKPPQPREKKIGQLTAEQVDQFFDKVFSNLILFVTKPVDQQKIVTGLCFGEKLFRASSLGCGA